MEIYTERNFEVFKNDCIVNKLELLELIYVRYKWTNKSKGIILKIKEKIYHMQSIA